ncbi:MAG TPA: DUF3352 domain-containing protein [Candidatus Levilactobacillus faecigallinarum]|uniref:DUF3352 domain-containing protein n=1 Tax=Candidatus Levilactobacillus faecigallinarum TaxID=2838638 RepID=A0A9D1U612_9LACO|nr:DUF3352 domain-containing protein [Candidatus Levilactobacillus faecigallinarum]
MNLKRVIIGLSAAIVLLAAAGGISWVLTSRRSTTSTQLVTRNPPVARVVPFSAD